MRVEESCQRSIFAERKEKREIFDCLTDDDHSAKQVHTVVYSKAGGVIAITRSSFSVTLPFSVEAEEVEG